MSRYKICRDAYLGYEVQIRYRWWPFWIIIESNTWQTIEQAEQFARRHKKAQSLRR